LMRRRAEEGGSKEDVDASTAAACGGWSGGVGRLGERNLRGTEYLPVFVRWRKEGVGL